MSKFVVIVFPDQARAYEGTRALKELHAEGSLTLYGMAVIQKDPVGKISIKDAADPGPLGTAVGALVGGIVGLIGGPAGVIAGAAGGTAVGSMVDLFNYGIGSDFILKVSNELGSGKTALIAEIAESWTTPLDSRMEALSGKVLRTWRADFEDEQLATEAAQRKADFEQLRSEYAQASAEAKAKVKAKLDQVKADLKQSDDRLHARIDALNSELKARSVALNQQVANARADAKEKINQRVTTLRAEYEKRSAKLNQAWALTKEALAA